MTARVPAMGALIVRTKTIAATVAKHGGRTFQTNMFSAVNTALEVAVTRLVNVPGRRSEKLLGECPIKWWNKSRRRSPVTPTKVWLAIQNATRHKRLSAAMSEPSRKNAVQTAELAPAVSVSTRNLMPYCVQTEQATAARTAPRMARWENGRKRM